MNETNKASGELLESLEQMRSAAFVGRCHDAALPGAGLVESIDKDRAAIKAVSALVAERDALAAESKALQDALFGLIGHADDPNCGWRGTAGTSDLYACEYCREKHEDCTKIEHADWCPVPPARKAIDAARTASAASAQL